MAFHYDVLYPLYSVLKPVFQALLVFSNSCTGFGQQHFGFRFRFMYNLNHALQKKNITKEM